MNNTPMNTPPLKFSANISMLFTEYDFLDRFSAAADNGFKAVEIQFPYDTALIDIQKAQDKSQLAIALINLAAGDLMQGGEGLACVPKRRDEFKRAVEQSMIYAENLNVERVNVLAGKCFEEKNIERYYDTLLTNLDYAADQLQSLGIGVVFEAINTADMPHFLIHSVEQMTRVIRDLNHSNLAMQYDIYHMATMGEPIQEQLPDLINAIGHIQFADTPHRHEPGSGELALTDIFVQLKTLGYTGWLGAEYKPSTNTEDTFKWFDEFR
jgi:hydroxypyruvate isomerase